MSPVLSAPSHYRGSTSGAFLGLVSSITVLLRAEKDRFGGTRGIQAHNVTARTVSAPAPPGAGVDRPALAPQSRRPTPTGIPTGRGGGRTPPLARITGVPAAPPRLRHTGCYTGQDRCAPRLNPPPLLQRPRPPTIVAHRGPLMTLFAVIVYSLSSFLAGRGS